MCSFVFFFSQLQFVRYIHISLFYHLFSFLLFFFLKINQWLHKNPFLKNFYFYLFIYIKILLKYSVVHVHKFPWGKYMINVQPVHSIMGLLR